MNGQIVTASTSCRIVVVFNVFHRSSIISDRLRARKFERIKHTFCRKVSKES